MDPSRLRPAVEIPIRRVRPVAAGAALAVLFSLGAYNYLISMRPMLHPPRGGVALTFATEPSGAEVVRETSGEVVCRTPCSVEVQPGRFGIATYRLERPFYASQRVMVDLRGGDTRVEAVLVPRHASAGFNISK
jgi:hypothetical protein